MDIREVLKIKSVVLFYISSIPQSVWECYFSQQLLPNKGGK